MKVMFLFFLILSVQVSANVLEVPDEYSTIQSAINASQNGDTVLVSPGTYFENINFNGKNILVTSHFILNNDFAFITNTIIDGSNPSHPDTASCVIIISGEDSTAILQGFTITGGKGTAWPDEHSSGTFREGGGILMALSSPVIQYNLIINNEAIDRTGLAGAGGGGIRSGDGFPKILNNVIMNNKGRYGGGIVLNYCSAIVRNNIVIGNNGGEDYGGGGIWINDSNGLPNILENNNILSNNSVTDGGGILIYSPTITTVKNNIIFGNTAGSSPQIGLRSGSSISATYNNIEGGFNGTGNFSLTPSFADSSFYLNDGSPCIDAGDPDVQYNDLMDPNSPGNALWPSKGTLRNDVGTYGGPFSYLFPEFSTTKLFIPSSEYDFGLTLPGEPANISIPVINNGATLLKIDSVSVLISGEINLQNSFPIIIKPIVKDSLKLNWIPQAEEILMDTLLIYHNDSGLANPYKLALKGNSIPNALLHFNSTLFNYGDIEASIQRVDTTLYIYNFGTADDSVYASIIYGNLTPDTALEIAPRAFIVAPTDSVGIDFTIYPPKIHPTGFNIFQPKIVIDSRFSVGTTHFEKTMRFHLVGVVDVENETGSPSDFYLSQNYPNPFNPVTNVKYSIPQSSFVSIKIYDILGNEVATLVNEEKPAGEYEIKFNGNNLSSGVYFYRLETNEFQKTLSMVLMK